MDKIPNELLLNIANFLTPKDIKNLASTCKSFFPVFIERLYRDDIRSGRYCALPWAVRDSGILPTVKRCLEMGADINYMFLDSYARKTPWLLVLNSNRSEIVRYLLDQGADPYRTMGPHSGDRYRTTPLIMAITANRLKMVHYLLAKGADPNQAMVPPLGDQYRTTPLTLAVIANRLKMVHYLLAKGADPNQACADPSLFFHYRTPLQALTMLFLTIRGEKPKKRACNIMKALLEYGADPNTRADPTGEFPLKTSLGRDQRCLYLSEECPIEATQMLLDNRAITLSDETSRPGDESWSKPLVEILQQKARNEEDHHGGLLTQKVDLILKYYPGALTSDAWSAVLGCIPEQGTASSAKLLKLALAHGWNCDTLVKRSIVPLVQDIYKYSFYDQRWYKAHYSVDMLRALLQAGADPSGWGEGEGGDVSAETHSPLWCLLSPVKGDRMSRKYISEAALMLLEHGARVNFPQHEDGDSLLHRACRWSVNNCAFIGKFLQLGADVHRRNRRGRTALHNACRRYDYNLEVIDLLVKNGADMDAEDKDGCTPRMLLSRRRGCSCRGKKGGDVNMGKGESTDMASPSKTPKVERTEEGILDELP